MGQTRYIVAGSFIDGSGGEVRRNVYLAVDEGVISDIGPVTDLPKKDGALIDDYSHCVILPALFDCSVSLSRSSSVDKDVRLWAEGADFTKKLTLFEQHVCDCHAHGVHGVAENDEISELLAQYQQSHKQKSFIDIMASGGICQTLKDCTNDNVSGADFLKIGYSCNIEDGDKDNVRPALSRNDLCSILKSKGAKKAVVVANGSHAVDEALEAGCDAIEQGYGMGENALRKMAKKGVLWIPSVLRAKNALDGSGSGGNVCCRFSLRYVAPGKLVPGAEAYWKKMLADHLTQLRLARTLGVKTAVGTGAGSAGILHGESMVEEMKLFIKAGYSLEEIFQCASENGARFFGMEGVGALSVGRKATFLISRGTVGQLPRKLAYLEGIYVDGIPSALYHKHPAKAGSQIDY